MTGTIPPPPSQNKEGEAYMPGAAVGPTGTVRPPAVTPPMDEGNGPVARGAVMPPHGAILVAQDAHTPPAPMVHGTVRRRKTPSMLQAIPRAPEAAGQPPVVPTVHQAGAQPWPQPGDVAPASPPRNPVEPAPTSSRQVAAVEITPPLVGAVPVASMQQLPGDPTVDPAIRHHASHGPPTLVSWGASSPAAPGGVQPLAPMPVSVAPTYPGADPGWQGPAPSHAARHPEAFHPMHGAPASRHFAHAPASFLAQGVPTGSHPVHASPPASSGAPPTGSFDTGAWPVHNGVVPQWVPGPDRPSVVIHSPRGTYQVGREVGSGHFGAVFECAGPFDQRYALKVLRPTGRPIDKVREEWTSEVRRLMQLRHPNVVYIHDAFEWQGTFCVALEWCDHTLRDMLEQPLQEELAIELSRQMLAAVQYLHDWDLVHDDLHPGNVLIQQSDRPIVKISDFGISAELRGAPKVRPEIVHHAIMAPELVAAGYTSKQSDLYQLGMIMYWMITGEPPVPVGVPYEQLVHQISEGIARQRAERLGTPFGNVVAKMLRRRDAYRYTSAREVWQDLRELPAWRARQLFHPR